MRNNNIFRLVLASVFLCMAYVLPFLTGQIPEFGSMLCPMHIPVILCGFICGWKYGLVVGIISPIFRSLTLGMPPLFPTAFSMSFELGAYGLLSGILYNHLLNCIFKKKELVIYLSLIISMVVGRLIYGTVMFVLMGFGKVTFSLKMFWVGTIVESIPGIILQIILIPLIILIFEKYKKNRFE